MTELTGSLGKIGQDVAIMALRGSERHPRCPVVARLRPCRTSKTRSPPNGWWRLARFNATLMGGMHQAQIHELERSGAAMMLEWMLLPQICETAGASLSAASMLVQSIEHMGKAA
jgi:3-carboxy-cis,cis-muconate cycloisomerase